MCATFVLQLKDLEDSVTEDDAKVSHAPAEEPRSEPHPPPASSEEKPPDKSISLKGLFSSTLSIVLHAQSEDQPSSNAQTESVNQTYDDGPHQDEHKHDNVVDMSDDDEKVVDQKVSVCQLSAVG